MKSLLETFCILLMIGIIGTIVGVAVKAQTEGTVTATVAIGTISVTVATSTFDYGTLPFSASKESFDVVSWSNGGGPFNNIRATVGTVETDLDINATSTAAWTLAGSIGANQYVHKFATSTDGTIRPSGYVALTGSYDDNVLATNVAASGNVWFGLEIYTPSSGETAQQSAGVSIRATWSE